MPTTPHSEALAKNLEDKSNNKPNANEYLDYVQKNRQGYQNSNYDFIFADEKIARIKEIIDQIADANVPVLITGESGTGKEVIARMVHAASERKDQPFVGINCAALPPNLLESELFGHEKGAFTGAENRHIGKFEQAEGGTLLLDEVTETDQGLQAKLLRALQEKEIERIGGEKAIPINTRIIATTNRDITQTVSEGRFRQDLFYRLYVIHLEIPPLRERKKDIEVLSRHFLKKFSMQFRQQDITMSADAMHQLLQYPWPGNVRELQNVIQRAVLMAQSNMLTSDDFNLSTKTTTPQLDWIKHLPIGQKMRTVETHFIIETLRQNNGNRTHSAKTLGISLRTLRNKINEFTSEGYEVPQPTLGKPL